MLSFLQYTLILLSLYLISLLRNNISSKKNPKHSFYLLLSLGLMCFMTSFRAYDIGNDTEAYCLFFESFLNGDYGVDTRIESGYRFLNQFIARFSDDFTVFLSITSVILFASLFVYIQKKGFDNQLYSVLFWLFGYTSFVSPLRQSLALVFIFISLFFLERRKGVFFVLFCFLASLFHRPAIICLLLLPLYYVRPSFKSYLFTAVIVLILVFSNAINHLTGVFDKYYLHYFDTQSGWAAVLFNCLFGLTPILIDANKKEHFGSASFISLSRWGCFLYILCYLCSLYSSGMGRIAYYFLPMVLSYWCYVISRLKGGIKPITIILLIGILVTYDLLAIKFRPEWNSFFPFHYVWESRPI